MNMVVENAANGVSDSDYTVRHAAKRCTMSTSFSAAAKKWPRPHGETGLAAMMVRESGAEAP